MLSEWEDDEDLSPSERALVAKADKDLAKRGVKVKDFNPDKIIGKGKESHEEEGDEVAPQHKKTQKPTERKQGTIKLGADAAKKKETSRGEQAVQARKFLQDNPSATRKQFATFMVQHGTGAAYASTMFYALKKKLSEVFFITNDQGQVLAEGNVWTVFEDYSTRLLMFKSEWNAKSRTLQTGGEVNNFSLK